VSSSELQGATCVKLRRERSHRGTGASGLPTELPRHDCKMLSGQGVRGKSVHELSSKSGVVKRLALSPGD